MAAFLRFRIYIEGELKASDHIDCEDVDMAMKEIEAVSAYQVAMTELATLRGQVWMLECYDPDKPEDQAYTRFGTDESMMTEPKLATMDQIVELVNKLD